MRPPRHPWRKNLDKILVRDARVDLEASDERENAVRLGTLPISEAQERAFVKLSGVIRSVTYSPPGSSVGLVAVVFDGSASIDLVWLGRREISAINVGRRVIAEGVVTLRNGHLCIINPVYEVLPLAEEQ